MTTLLPGIRACAWGTLYHGTERFMCSTSLIVPILIVARCLCHVELGHWPWVGKAAWMNLAC